MFIVPFKNMVQYFVSMFLYIICYSAAWSGIRLSGINWQATAMATKFGTNIGYNSACVKDFGEISAPVEGFQGCVIECCQSHFPPTDPWQRNLGQNWL